jgi:hypothetical protein
MRINFFALAALSASAALTAPISVVGAVGSGLFVPEERQRRGKGQNNRRGKGARSQPKAKPNRLHVSKRVRRKHRRAA